MPNRTTKETQPWCWNSFDNGKCITWHFIDGSTKKIAPFKYHPKRNIGDQFMNVNNDIATAVLACNSNVTIVDKACFFYAILYQIKHNQKEESYTYHSKYSVCIQSYVYWVPECMYTVIYMYHVCILGLGSNKYWIQAVLL